MTTRRFRVVEYTYNDTASNREEGIVGKVAKYVVTDANKDETNRDKQGSFREHLADFPVSHHNDAETQNANAHKLADYLNAVRDAQDKAVSDDALLQKIML